MPRRSLRAAKEEDLQQQQHGEEVAVLRGADDRGEAPVVLRVDVRAGPQQRQHRPQVALERRPVQRRVPVVAHCPAARRRAGGGSWSRTILKGSRVR